MLPATILLWSAASFPMEGPKRNLDSREDAEFNLKPNPGKSTYAIRTVRRTLALSKNGTGNKPGLPI